MKPGRFCGDVDPIGPVDVAAMAAWIAAIDLREWPQQSFTELKPAMVTDLGWHKFRDIADPVVKDLMRWFPGCAAYQWMLSVVMPGNTIPPHRDLQPPEWLCRVHAPLTSNDLSSFVVGGRPHHLDVGMAYRVNTLAEHSVANDGQTPRVHFMFDVRTR